LKGQSNQNLFDNINDKKHSSAMNIKKSLNFDKKQIKTKKKEKRKLSSMSQSSGKSIFSRRRSKKDEIF